MTPFFGGFDPTDAYWLGPNHVAVEFDSSYPTSGAGAKRYQLYAGRTLIGVTKNNAATRVDGQLNPSASPAPLTIVAVDPSDSATDFSDQIRAWPTDRYRLFFTVTGSDPNTDRFVVTGADAPGGSIDPTHVLATIAYVGDGPYTVDLPPLGQCGTWPFAVTPFDDAKPNGNPGTPATISVVAIVPPPDVVPDSDGNRFTTAVAAGVLTVSFAY